MKTQQQDDVGTPPPPPPHGIPPELQSPIGHSLLAQASQRRPLPPLPDQNDTPKGPFSLRASPQSGHPNLPKRKPISLMSNPLASRSGLGNAFNSSAGLYFQRLANEPPPYAEQTAPYPEDEIFPDATNWLPGARENPISFPKAKERPEERPSLPLRRTDRPLASPQGQQSTIDIRSDRTAAVSLGTKLTLIRRDPSTGDQWNVAHIDDPTEVQKSPSGRRSVRVHGLPINVAIDTPGYSKFVLDQARSVVSSNSRESNSNTAMLENDEGKPAFERRLVLEDTRILPFHKKTNSAGNITRKPVGSKIGTMTEPGRSSADFGWPQSPSVISLAQTGSDMDGHGRNSKSRSYSFDSPWLGRCEFSAAIGSSSLKVSIGSNLMTSRGSLRDESVNTA
jgi:hypothetical protein